jgi:hypothetical protein
LLLGFAAFGQANDTFLFAFQTSIIFVERLTRFGLCARLSFGSFSKPEMPRVNRALFVSRVPLLLALLSII